MEARPSRRWEKTLAIVEDRLGRPAAKWFIIAAALLLTSTSLSVGLGADDFFHELMLREDPGIAGLAHRPLDLFAFATGDPRASHDLMDVGVFPWWVDPHVVLAFFRPLSSLSHWVDHLLWPDHPWLMHAQSLLWFGLLLLVVGVVYRKLMGPGWTAGLALFLYALDDARGPVVGWLANRNAIIALSLALPALVAHHRFRREGHRPSAWLGPLSFILGLLAGETALLVCGYLFSYAVCLDEGRWKARLGSLWPYLTIVVLWRTFYVYVGYGTIGSGVYIDPGREPFAFASALVTRLPVLLLAEFAMPWADFWDVYPLVAPAMRAPVMILAIVVAAGLVVLLLPLWKSDRLLRFWSLGCLLALIPMAATFPHDRLLMAAGIGGMAVVAMLLAAWVKGTYPRRAPWVSAACVGLVGLHIFLGPALLPVRALGAAAVHTLLRRADETVPSTPDITDKSVVLINPPADPYAAYFQVYRQAKGIPRPRFLRWFATGVTDLQIDRIDEYSLRFRPAAGFLSSSSQVMLRSLRRPIPLGETISLSDATVEVTALTGDGRPQEILVRFRVKLEDDSLRWLKWGQHGYVPFALPAVGASVFVPAVDMRSVLFG